MLSALLLAGAALAADVPPTTPWKTRQTGWVFLEEQGPRPGGMYHDAGSGACVSFDAALPTVVPPVGIGPADKGFERGMMGLMPYRMLVTQSSGCAGGRHVRASFMPDGLSETSIVWDAESEACTGEQYQRVRAFLLGEGSGPDEGAAPAPPREVTRAMVSALAPGSSYDDVHARLGPTTAAECRRDGSFVGIWGPAGDPRHQHRLTFERDHTLSSK